MGSFSEFIRGWFLVILLVTVVANVTLLVGMFAYSNQTDQDLDASGFLKLEPPQLGKDSFNFVPDRSLRKSGTQRVNRMKREMRVKGSNITDVEEHDRVLQEKALKKFQGNYTLVTHRKKQFEENYANVSQRLPQLAAVKELYPAASVARVNVSLADNSRQRLNQPVKLTTGKQQKYRSGRKKTNQKKHQMVMPHEAGQLQDISKVNNKQIGKLQGNNRETEQIHSISNQTNLKAENGINKQDTDNMKDAEKREEPVRYYMTIDPPKGGLCNQVFQLAALVGLAQRHNYTAFLPMVGFNINEAFVLPRDFYQPISLHTFKPVYNFNPQNQELENTKYKYIEALDKRANWSLNGYFQSYRFFWDARDEVRAVLKLKKSHLKKADLFLKAVPPDHKKVGIHVRRGDFLTLEQRRLGRVAATPGYLAAAITYFIRKFGGKVTFVVISDDISWCRYNINRGNLLFSDLGETGADLALMSKCDHAIITVGTFSWWSGFLTRGIVIYYDEYPKQGSELYDVFVKEDYYPKEWIGMKELNMKP